MGEGTEMIAEENGRNTIPHGMRAVTGMRLELLADFFRTLKEMRKKLDLKAKHYSKIGEVGRSTRMTKKTHFFYRKVGKM